MARNININLQGKDNVSPALQTASARLVELRTEIDKLRAKGQVNLTVADTKNLTKLTSEANRLEKALGGVGQTGQRITGQLGGLQNVLGGLGLGGLTSLATGAGIAAAVTQVGKLTVELGNLGAQSIVTRDSFESVMASVGESPALLDQLSAAAGGTITQMRLMQLANTAVAGASEELGGAFAEALPKLIEGARAANQLNPALGDTEFLFNSLVTGIKRGSPMLIDNTGITLKLGEANEAYAKSLGKSADALTEEEKKLALLQATMDGVDRLVQQAGGSLDNLTTSTQQLTTAWQDLKTAVGEGLAPIVAAGQSSLAEGLTRISASIQAGSDNAAIAMSGMRSQLQLAQQELENIEAQPVDPNDEFGTTAARVELLRRRIAELETQIYSAGGAEQDMAEKLRGVEKAMGEVEGAIDGVHDALGETSHWDKFKALGRAAANSVKSDMLIARAEAMGLLQAEPTTTGTFTEPSKTYWGYYTDYARKVAGGTQSQSEIDRLIDNWKENVGRVNTDTAEDFRRKYQAAIDDLTGDVQSKLGGAIQDSIGLKDMTGGDAFAPGANGPFEALFRAQAVAVGGIENADEQKWAEMYGLTPESAAKIVSDFQRGLFSADVIKLIDVNALVGQIQGEQAAAESTQAFAQMIAGQLGVKDAGSLVASQTFQAIAGGVASDPTQQANAAQAVLSAYAQNVEKVVKSGDFAGQMMGFGEATWKSYEDGLLGGAESSAVFNEAIKKAIASFLTANGYTKQPTGGGVVGAVNNAGGALP